MSDYTDFYKGLYEDAQEEIARLRERDDDAMGLSINMNEKLLDEINVLEDKLVSDTTLTKGIYQTYGWVKAQEKKKKGFPPLAIIIHYIEEEFICDVYWDTEHYDIHKSEKLTSLVQEIFTGAMKLLAEKCHFTFTYEKIPYTLETFTQMKEERKGWKAFPNIINIDDCHNNRYIIKPIITMKYTTTKLRQVAPSQVKTANDRYERTPREQIIDWGNEWWMMMMIKCMRTTNEGKLLGL
jgi:hypothetical protein